MVTRGEIMGNLEKLQDMFNYLEMLMNLHQTALFSWNIEGKLHTLPQTDINELIARYKSLKGQLATKYGNCYE